MTSFGSPNIRSCAAIQRSLEDVAKLMGEERAAVAFNDFPYNIAARHVAVRKDHQRAFAMASGEQSGEEFLGFLTLTSTNTAAFLILGGLMYGCSDRRQIERLLAAGRAAGFELLNLCAWTKPAAGMGKLYPSQHELIPVFRKPGASHVNNIQLGKNGRYRTNCWSYPAAPAFSKAARKTPRTASNSEAGEHGCRRAAGLLASWRCRDRPLRRWRHC